MRLSIFTTITNPEERQDPWMEALESFNDLADEVIVINGGLPFSVDIGFKFPKINEIEMPMPDNWAWEELPKRVNAGLEASTGDWAISMDIDWMFHEDDFKRIREQLESIGDPVAAFQKAGFYGTGTYMKGYMPIAVNKRMYSELIKFGSVGDHDDNLVTPIYADYKNDKGVWVGIIPEKIAKVGIQFFNFDYTFKDDKAIEDCAFKASMARVRSFGKQDWGISREEAFTITKSKLRARALTATPIALDKLPKYIQKRASKYYESKNN